MPPIFFQLQAAVTAARDRTGDKSIGTQTRNGRLQIVRVTYDNKGVSVVTPLTGWLSAPAAIAALAAI